MSSAIFSTLISKAPFSLSVPANVWSPAVFSIGIDSPVMVAWLTVLCPESTIPSTGMLSPGLTKTISPFLTSSMGT